MAFVLGAQVYPSGTPSRFLRLGWTWPCCSCSGARRSPAAVQGRAAPEYDGGGRAAHLLAARAADDRLVLDPLVWTRTTPASGPATCYGVPRVVMVTQTYHLPPAVGTARLVGLNAVESATGR